MAKNIDNSSNNNADTQEKIPRWKIKWEAKKKRDEERKKALAKKKHAAVERKRYHKMKREKAANMTEEERKERRKKVYTKYNEKKKAERAKARVKRMKVRERDRLKAKQRQARMKLREKQSLISKKKRYKKFLRYMRIKYRVLRDDVVRERIANGDEQGTYMIFLAKNFRVTNRLYVTRLWKSRAISYYEKLIEKNKEVEFPMELVQDKYSRPRPFTCELLLVKLIEDDENNVSIMRNDDGKFVEHYFENCPNYKILDKIKYNIEEKFYVYGYNPMYDKKPYRFIFDNVFLKDIEKYDDIKCVYTFGNKVIFDWHNDLDFVICKNGDVAIKLYNKLLKDAKSKKIKSVVFMGAVSKLLAPRMIDRLVDKTGWPRQVCGMV